MPHLYKVQVFELTGVKIDKIFTDPDVDSIIFRLYENAAKDTLFLQAYAANQSDKWLYDIAVDFKNKPTVSLKDKFVERKIYLTREMVDQVKADGSHSYEIRWMKFTPRAWPYRGNEYPGDKGKEFMAYKVNIKRDKKR